jgi:hypothetical protein
MRTGKARAGRRAGRSQAADGADANAAKEQSIQIIISNFIQFFRKQ